MYINPDDLPDLGPMPEHLFNRLVDRTEAIYRRHPEILNHLLAQPEAA